MNGDDEFILACFWGIGSQKSIFLHWVVRACVKGKITLFSLKFKFNLQREKIVLYSQNHKAKLIVGLFLRVSAKKYLNSIYYSDSYPHLYFDSLLFLGMKKVFIICMRDISFYYRCHICHLYLFSSWYVERCSDKRKLSNPNFLR